LIPEGEAETSGESPSSAPAETKPPPESSIPRDDAPDAEAGSEPPSTKPGASDYQQKGEAEDWLDWLPHPNAGAATVTTWDSVQRGKYTAGNAKRSAEAVSRIRAYTEADDAVGAWEAGKKVSETRNAARVATQRKLSPGGRAMSEAIDAGRNFKSPVAEYTTRTPGARTPSPTRSAYTIAERVAEGSGRSNPWMSRLARGGKVLGPPGIAVGLAFAGRNIYNATPEERERVTAGEGGTFLGGMIGASLGMSAGVMLAAIVSWFLLGLGVIAAPIALLAIGLGIIGAIAGAWAFGNAGRGIGETLYEW
jgi:hypothetical protein